MAKTAERSSKASGAKGGTADDLADLRVPELRDRAKKLDISGVSGMKKDELIAAIRKADGGGSGTGSGRGAAAGRGRAAKDGASGGGRRGAAPRRGRTAGGAAASDDTLRTIDEKFAEVMGLARAASKATERVAGLVEDDERRRLLDGMRQEAEETARRCGEALGAFGARAPKIEEKAGETTEEAVQMMETYLGGEDVEALDGFEFLIMAEAGETGHLQVLRAMNESAGEDAIRELTDFALPIQERHFSVVMDTALALASEEDPLEPA